MQDGHEYSHPEVPDVSTRLARLVRLARWVLGFERAWPRCVAGLVLVSLFITVSWLGLWLIVPPWLRLAAVTLFAVGLIGAVVFAWRLPRPGTRDGLVRLDHDSGLDHRVATDLADQKASVGADPVTQALWQAHRARIAAKIADLRLKPPAPRMFDRDPYALRYAAVFALVIAAVVAGPEREARLVAAFDWASAGPGAAAPRLDGWVNPPGYTQIPPVLLDLRTSSARQLRVPVRSEIVIHATEPKSVEVTGQGGLDHAPPQATESGKEWRFILTGDASVAIRGRGITNDITITAIPDRPPTITLTEAPVADRRGGLSLSYAFEDDYGVVSGEIAVRALLRNGAPLTMTRLPLVPPPSIALGFGSDPRGGEAKTAIDLRDHPWGGVEVEAELVVRDDPGQEGRSARFRMTIPQRSFTKPLARALVEQRRNLIVDPGSKPRILEALYALMIAPARFASSSAVYLGLRSAVVELTRARTDPQLIEVADMLWGMAVAIEDGGESDAERALRAAEQALREAIERNASPEELRRLMDELRQAMNRALQELAERMLNDPNAPQMRAEDMRNMRMLTPQDLKSMLDRMDQAMRRGDMAEAQRMLDQLRDVMKNLQTAQPRRDNGQAREMDRALDELDTMTREQQDLRDRTFREGQRQREQARRQRQQGQQGQQGQQQGQQGTQPGDGADSMQSLAERQKALRKRLEDMRNRMNEMGAGDQEGFGEAEQSMGQAGDALGKGADGEAVDAQGRALENLRKGAQNLARQMQQQPGDDIGENDGNGDPNGPGNPQARRADGGPREEDPLGRTKPTGDPSDGARLRGGGKKGQLELRAREVLDELRRRLGDTERPQTELDYLQRLLGTQQ
jgi:uncharacterized protein (TIGR02302 family)